MVGIFLMKGCKLISMNKIPDIEHLKQKLETETNPLVKWRIEKQIELLEDALVIYHERRLPDK
jgi:hypothetical protein